MFFGIGFVLGQVWDWFYAWQKWGLAKEQKALQLGKGQKEQTPGQLRQDVLSDLDDWVKNLPVAKVYKKLKVWYGKAMLSRENGQNGAQLAFLVVQICAGLNENEWLGSFGNVFEFFWMFENVWEWWWNCQDAPMSSPAMSIPMVWNEYLAISKYLHIPYICIQLSLLHVHLQYMLWFPIYQVHHVLHWLESHTATAISHYTWVMKYCQPKHWKFKARSE